MPTVFRHCCHALRCLLTPFESPLLLLSLPTLLRAQFACRHALQYLLTELDSLVFRLPHPPLPPAFAARAVSLLAREHGDPMGQLEAEQQVQRWQPNEGPRIHLQRGPAPCLCAAWVPHPPCRRGNDQQAVLWVPAWRVCPVPTGGVTGVFACLPD